MDVHAGVDKCLMTSGDTNTLKALNGSFSLFDLGGEILYPVALYAYTAIVLCRSVILNLRNDCGVILVLHPHDGRRGGRVILIFYIILHLVGLAHLVSN